MAWVRIGFGGEKYWFRSGVTAGIWRLSWSFLGEFWEGPASGGKGNPEENLR